MSAMETPAADADPPSAAADRPYGWLIVAVLGLGQIVAWGVLYYSFSVFVVPLREEFGWSTAAITGAFSVALGVSALVGVAVGRWLDSHSPRPLMTAAALAAGLLVVAWSRVETLIELYAVFAGIGAVMAALLYEPAFIVVTKWFVARRREALTAVVVLAGLASFIFSPLSERLIGAIGWRDALLVLAAAVAAIAFLFALVLRPSPTSTAAAVPAAAVPRRSFWLLSLAFVAGAVATTPISVLLVPLLVDSGHSAAFAAAVAGIVGIAHIPGRLLYAAVAKRLRGGRLPAAVYGSVAASLLVLAFDRGSSGAIAFAVLFGVSGAMITLVRAVTVADVYGQTRYGAVTGAIGAQVATARAVAPFVAAAFAAVAGYQAMLLVLAAATTVAACAGARGVTRSPASMAVTASAVGSPTLDDAQATMTTIDRSEGAPGREAGRVLGYAAAVSLQTLRTESEDQARLRCGTAPPLERSW